MAAFDLQDVIVYSINVAFSFPLDLTFEVLKVSSSDLLKYQLENVYRRDIFHL